MNTYSRICGIPGGGRWMVEEGQGMGGYGHPPEHPTNRFCIVEFRGSRSESYETALSLPVAAKESWVPDAVRAKARALLGMEEPDEMNAYRAREIRDVIEQGPNPGEDFYRLQVRGVGSSNWVNVSPAQLDTIASVFDSGKEPTR